MKSFIKITSINLLIFVAYSLLLTLIRLPHDELGLGAVIIWCEIMAAHSLTNLFISIYYFTKKRKQLAIVFLSNIFIIPLIGYSICTYGFK
jgi:hypothetical protein